MAPPAPPPTAERLLLVCLRDTAEARTILGDLAEDFASLVADRGRSRAVRWYWREAVSLSFSALVGRALGRPVPSTASNRTRTHMPEETTSSGFLRDAGYALRAVRRDPGFLVFATLVIGLGVGASTAVFSVVSPLLLQPLPFQEPDRLVLIENDGGGGGLSAVTSRTSNVRDFRERARSFEGIAGYNAFFEQESYNLVGTDRPERLIGVGVTHDFLDVLGVPVLRGRNFTVEEGLWGGPAAVLLTHGFWVRRFAGDPSVVGSTITLDGGPREVVGILPPSFDFTSVFTPTVPVDILVPWPIGDETDRWGNTTTMVARLAPGVSVEAAQSELESIVAALEAAEPNRWGLGAATSGLQERIARPFRSGMLLLVSAAGLVMLIVCVNLSNMLLARSPRRRREMAVRRTLGATRGRLVRQLLMESVMVSLCGGALGAIIAVTASRFVARTQGLEIPLLDTVSVDGSALAFTLAVAVVAGLLVGIVPALQVAEGGEAEALSGSSRGSSIGRGGVRVREMLVVSEVAMACVLLILGGLVLRSFQQVMDVDLGFDADRLIAWQISPSRSFESLPATSAYFDEVVRAVEAVPGVRAAGYVDALPLGRNRTWGTRVVGRQYEGDEGESFFPHIVDHRYLDAMGIPLLSGRRFTPDDDVESARVAILNESAARVMFPDGDALGSFLSIGPDGTEVVGIVGDVRHEAIELGGASEVYFPTAQVWDYGTLDMVVRTDLPYEAIAGPVMAAIASVDAQIPTEDVRTLTSIVERSVSPRRFTLQLLGAFALSALILAGVGIYGVLSYSVTERIPEIGIRMALGESAAEVRQRVVGQTLRLALIGVVVGSGAALLGTRLLGSLLYGVEPTDPATFIGMIGLLLAVAFVSGLIPAVRASRTDSAGALRSAA